MLFLRSYWVFHCKSDVKDMAFHLVSNPARLMLFVSVMILRIFSTFDDVRLMLCVSVMILRIFSTFDDIRLMLCVSVMILRTFSTFDEAYSFAFCRGLI